MSTLTVAVLEPRRQSSVPRWAELKGRGLALRAAACLRQRLAEPPSIAALCSALGTSERTLHEAFREHLDATPKAYLKGLRLDAARRDLLEAEEGVRVTDVALDYGFLHFGWFSQDYRRLFGETPSQTLRRGRDQTRRSAGAPHHSWSAGVRARSHPLENDPVALGA